MKNIDEKYGFILNKLINEYQRTSEPIDINFREMVGEDIKSINRQAHLIHSYPAKLLMHIPFFFLNNNYLSKKGDLIMDPFCGTGTVLLEAILAERNSIGADSNPLARLITEAKITFYEIKKLELTLNQIVEDFNFTSTNNAYPDVVNIDYWFDSNTIKQLSKLRSLLDGLKNEELRTFFLVCFSNTVRKVSLADPRISVPVKLKLDKYPEGHPSRNAIKKRLDEVLNTDVLDKFVHICEENIRRIARTQYFRSNEIFGNIISKDARALKSELCDFTSNKKIKSSNVDLIITSPPYAGAQKYIRASGLNLGWLGYTEGHDLRQYKTTTIGREEYRKKEYSELITTGIKKADDLLTKIYKVNPKRAHIAANYLIEMRDALQEITSVLKQDGYFILIIANNEVCGFDFKTQQYIKEIIEELGLNLILSMIDDIKSYGLMTKRNKTASVITREWILVFKKEI